MITRHIALVLYLFVLMCFLFGFFWQMKARWATAPISLFLDSNNVFENKVNAALTCSHYSKPASFMLFLSAL